MSKKTADTTKLALHVSVLSPRAGDILVFRVPETLVKSMAIAEISELVRQLINKPQYKGVQALVLTDGLSVEHLGVEEMKRLGWLRDPEHKSQQVAPGAG